ncbi:hypothetical protein CHUAL_007064 [Chamberlinius hualienensis]
MTSGRRGPNQEKSSVVFRGFYPIALLGRFLGLFPFVNIASRVSNVDNLKFKKIRFDLIFSFMTLSCFAYSYIVYLKDASFIDDSIGFKEVVLKVLSVATKMFSLTLVSLFIGKNRSIMNHIQRWNKVNNLLQPRSRSINVLGVALLIYSVSLVSLYILSVSNVYLTGERKTTLAIGLNIYVTACMVYTFKFTAVFVVFFSFCLQWSFEEVSNQLDALIIDDKMEYNLPLRLSKIRKCHETIVELVDDLSEIMSPALTLFFFYESVGTCVCFYELCYLVIHQEPLFSLMKSSVKLIVRLLPLIMVCVVANGISKKASLGCKKLRRCSFTATTRQCEFQIWLLMLQLDRRQVHLVANDVLVIDNRLLAEIFGLIITYIVVMLEISEDC